MNAITLNGADEPGGSDESRRQALGQIADALGKLGHPASVPEEIAELRRSVDSLRAQLDRSAHHHGCCCGWQPWSGYHYYPLTYTSVAAGGYVPTTYTSATSYPAVTTSMSWNPSAAGGYPAQTITLSSCGPEDGLGEHQSGS